MPSLSASAWSGLGTNGQLSTPQTMPSPSASVSVHVSPSSSEPSQSLSLQSQISGLPGKREGSPSSQSPSSGVTPSPSQSTAAERKRRLPAWVAGPASEGAPAAAP